MNTRESVTPKKDLTMPKYYRRVLVFDTETSRLMPKHKRGDPFPPDSEYPYIVQLSWIVYNLSTNAVEEVVNEYVSIPANVEIDPGSTRVTGITRETVDTKGVPIVPLLAQFFAAYMKCDCIVAHNMRFDGDVMRKEYWRNRKELQAFVKNQDRVNLMLGLFAKNFNASYYIDTFCTMMNTIGLCGIDFPKSDKELVMNNDEDKAGSQLDDIASKSSRKKFPRLDELYQKLFDSSPPEDLHNSIVDVLVCLRCFLKVRDAKELAENDFRTLVSQYSR